MPYTTEEHQKVAEQMPRDEHGHFAHIEHTTESPPEQNTANNSPVGDYLSKHVHSSKSDDLLDVHVGNPLHKIVTLLEDIKKQKAFSFTLRGSLGIAGVALALGVFGIFGASNLLCSKGVQRQIGVIKVLNVQEYDPQSRIPLISNVLDFFSPRTKHQSTVLVKQDNSVITIPYSRNLKLDQYNNAPVIATGNYDVCNQTLTVTDALGLETYPEALQ